METPAGGGGITYTNTSITTGTASTLPNAAYQIVTFSPAADLTTYTVTLPAAPTQNDIVEINATGTIAAYAAVATTFSVLPNSGQTISQQLTPTRLLGADVYKWRAASTTKWIRIQ
jgi:hypothetical protein